MRKSQQVIFPKNSNELINKQWHTICHVPLPARPFLSPSWPQCPSAVVVSPFSTLQSQPAPLPSERESSCRIPLSPASDGIAMIPVLGFDPADMLNRWKMH